METNECSSESKAPAFPDILASWGHSVSPLCLELQIAGLLEKERSRRILAVWLGRAERWLCCTFGCPINLEIDLQLCAPSFFPSFGPAISLELEYGDCWASFHLPEDAVRCCSCALNDEVEVSIEEARSGVMRLAESVRLGAEQDGVKIRFVNTSLPGELGHAETQSDCTPSRFFIPIRLNFIRPRYSAAAFCYFYIAVPLLSFKLLLEQSRALPLGALSKPQARLVPLSVVVILYRPLLSIQEVLDLEAGDRIFLIQRGKDTALCCALLAGPRSNFPVSIAHGKAYAAVQLGRLRFSGNGILHGIVIERQKQKEREEMAIGHKEIGESFENAIELPDISVEGHLHEIISPRLAQLPVRLGIRIGEMEISLDEFLELSPGDVIEYERDETRLVSLEVGGVKIASARFVEISNKIFLQIESVEETN